MEGFYGAVGLDLPVDKGFKLLAKPNSLKAYDLAMFYLAALNRDERSRLTEFLLNRVKACRRKPIAFRGVKFGEESVEGYAVLVSHWAREERRIALYNVAVGVGLKLKAKTIIGFAVGHDWPDSPTCDAIVLDASNMKVGPDLKTLAELAFGKARIMDRK